MYGEKVSVRAGADLSATQYKAVAVGGTIAATNTLAMGIQQNKPQSGEDLTISVLGKSRFVAGGAVAAGGAVKVTTSGFLIACASGDLACGKAISAVTSGSIGEGIFNFITRSNPGA